MLKYLVFSLMVASTQVSADGWNCSDLNAPSDCSGGGFGAYSAREHSCLLKLYTCGRYKEVVDQVEKSPYGSAREHNYFLGVSYFGLSLRNDAQSLKCFYMKQSKDQLEEFLLATQNKASSAINLGSDAEMDMLYHASRLSDILKKESGCAESSYSEGSLKNRARLYTAERMNNLLHDVPEDQGNDNLSNPAKAGFSEVRSIMNVFVTEASKLESRFSLYSAQIESSKKHLQDLAGFLQKEALNESIISYSVAEDGHLNVVVDQVKLNEFLGAVEAELDSKGLSALSQYEARMNDFVQKNGKYYDTLREEHVKATSTIISQISGSINTFKNPGEAAKNLREVDNLPQGHMVSLKHMGKAWGEFKSVMKNNKNCIPKRPNQSIWWFCK